MTDYLHIGGPLNGTTTHVPDNTLTYIHRTKTGPTTYIATTTSDNTNIYADATLCWRDTNNLYNWWRKHHPTTITTYPPTPTEPPATPEEPPQEQPTNDDNDTWNPLT